MRVQRRHKEGNSGPLKPDFHAQFGTGTAYKPRVCDILHVDERRDMKGFGVPGKPAQRILRCLFRGCIGGSEHVDVLLEPGDVVDFSDDMPELRVVVVKNEKEADGIELHAQYTQPCQHAHGAGRRRACGAANNGTHAYLQGYFRVARNVMVGLEG